MDKKAKLKIEARELHKPFKSKFDRRPVLVNGVDEVWGLDLVDMTEFSKQNKAFKYILTCIDVLSRFAWAVPLKKKDSETVMNAITKIITESDRHPKKIWCDKGAEFVNKTFKKNFDNVYHTYGEMKCAPIERFNRTLKEMMWYKFTQHDSKQWINRLDKLIKKYNEKVHSSIGIMPTQASERNSKGEFVEELYLLEKQSEKLKKIKKSSPKLKEGDMVRLAVVKGKFEKGYTERWTRELFQVTEIRKTKPTTYKVKDQKGEVLEGSFYDAELQKTSLK